MMYHKSFCHVGVWPHERTAIQRMIDNEKSCTSNLRDEIHKTIPMVVEQVLKIDEVRQAYKRNKRKEKENKKKQKHTFDTSFVCIGTSANRVTMLALNKEESHVWKLKVEDLQNVMTQKLGFSEDQLKNSTKWKTKVELHTMVDSYYAEKAKSLSKTIEEVLEKELTKFPAITPCSSIDFPSLLPSK